MYKKERRIGEAFKETFIKDILQRGFKDHRIIKDWKIIFSNSKEIDHSIFRPIKQKDSMLFVSTSDMDFYAKFCFVKSKIISEINQYFGEDFVKDIKIKLI